MICIKKKIVLFQDITPVYYPIFEDDNDYDKNLIEDYDYCDFDEKTFNELKFLDRISEILRFFVLTKIKKSEDNLELDTIDLELISKILKLNDMNN